MEKELLIAELKKIAGEDRVVTDENAVLDASKDYIGFRRYERDAGHNRVPRAACVVMAKDTQMVSDVLRFLNENKQDVVPRTGGSSVTRGVEPVEGGVILDGSDMTGILSIKKYQTQSALNNFQEYSMVDPGDLASFFGFTKAEVKVLAERHGMDYDELEKWYDGYQIGDELSMFNPNSVMQALRRKWCGSYWAKTGAFDSVSDYISMNFDGLKDDIVAMLAGESRPVDPTGFQNDLAIINNKDDALTVLIHLGYLSYDRREQECRIPNREVAGELVNAVRAVQWKNVFDAIQKSKQLLRATLDGDAEAVARGIDAAHDEETSILSYNNENSMACVLSIAYYYAKNDYIIHRELASGKAAFEREQSQACLNSAEREQVRTKFKGFADLVLLPRKNVSSPAIVIELKYDKDADTAIAQIKRKKYPAKVAQYTADLLLVGINYDKETKTHSCLIER